MLSSNGFLELESTRWSHDERKPGTASVERALELNRRCQEVLAGLGPRRFTGLQLMSAALFARLLEFFQAVVKCSAVGARAAAEVLLRAELEAVFTLRAISRDPEVLSAWTEQHHYFKKKLVAAIRDGMATWERPQEPGKAQKVWSILDVHLKSSKIPDLKTRDLAKKADMDQWYRLLYPRLEGPAHSKALDLERYFHVDAKKKVTGFGPLEDFSRIEQIVPTAAEILLLALQEVEKTFGLDNDPWFDAERTHFRKVAESQGAWRSRG